jgi:D-arabinose 5-phosphate isomerase GutQ
MWYQIKDIEAKIKRRASQQVCTRCGFYCPKKNSSCHHCSGMSDEEVLRNLARKKHFRVGMGKSMFIGAALILLLMHLI